MPTIHCTINDCHYWNQGNMCAANEILVAQDAWAAQAPDNVDVASANNLPQMEAHTCMETCCKSYVHKKSNQINADNVIRQ